MPEELWMEVRDIVQEAVIKTNSKKKKCKKAKLCRNNGKWNPSGMVSACFGLEPRIQRLSPSQALQGPAASPARFLASLRAFAEG